MKFLKILAFLLFFYQSSFAQNAQYFVAFRYKKSNFDLQHPLQYLSQKAIDRRTRQGIGIDSSDLPVVKFYVDSVKNHSIKIAGISKWLNGAIVEVTDSSQLNYLLTLPFVMRYEKVKAAEKSISATKFKEQISQPLSTANCCDYTYYGWTSNQVIQMHGEALHQQNFQGQNMQIAILDAGFIGVEHNSAYQNLWQENRILGFHNFTFQTDSVFTDAEHGGNVLSCMGVNLPGQFVGTAPQASFYLFETENNYSENLVEEYFWSVGAEHADSIGVDLINSSLGYTTFDFVPNNHVYAHDMNGHTNPSSIAASMAGQKGILVCVAAGNEGANNWHYISSPADADNILTVGAVDDNRHHAFFSSFGPSADGRVKPDVCAKGLNTAVITKDNYIAQGSGTSFASPTLCGLAACLWQKYPNKTAAEVRKAIQQSAHLYATPDDSMGYGIPDFRLADMILSGVNNALFNKNNNPVIFPNPTLHACAIYFYSNAEQQAYAELYGIDGRLMGATYFNSYENIFDTYSWDATQNLSRGVYFIRLRLNGNVYNLKLVKQ